VGSKLVKLFIDGGTPEEICHVGQVVPGATWGRDDSIIFTASPNSGLVRVSANGGTPERLTTPDYANGESSHGWPRFLPGDQHVIFTVSGGKGTHIAVLSMESGEVRRLVRGLGGAHYLSSGHLIFAQSEGLVAVAFDPVSLEVSGSPVLVLEDVYTIPASWGFGLSAFSVSENGLLAYLPGGTEAGTNRLVWVDRRGQIDPVSDVSGIYEWPRLSPDGAKIAVSNRTSDNMVGVWVLDVERDTRSRLAAERMSILPTWTPDGERLVFSSPLESRGVVNVFLKRADGTGEAHHILKSEHDRFPRSWSPDGRQLALTEWNPDTMRDIWVLTVDRSSGAELQFNAPTPLITTAADEYGPAFSPVGRWLAYVSDESGHYEVYVQSFPAGRGRWLISSGGGLEPIWSPDGTELFYRNGDVMMRVPVRTGDEFHAGAPEVLFERRLKRGIYDSLSYDISPDGTRFLMIQRNLENAPNELRVVHDWREVLRLRVPPTSD
jgi:Tol biopolymer transport system component